MILTGEQKNAIRQHIQRFHDYMKQEQFQQDQAERKQRITFFKNELKNRLDEFSEADFETIISLLWASRMWGNKTYLAQKIVNDNGLDKIKEELKKLVKSKYPEQAYSRFLQEIKGMGPASVTEILTYLHPDHCGIWNRQARNALKILKITDHINPEKYALSTAEYKLFNELLRAIAAELQDLNIQDVDLLMVDFFLYEVAKSTQFPVEKVSGRGTTEFDHNEIKDLIAQIGSSLGFDTDTEVKVAHGAVVDVVWRARIANLGLVTYVFEVHRSGSIDSLILNLQKAFNAPSVQKVIAVSDEAQLDRIKRECDGLPEEFRRALRFWEVSKVLETGEHLQKVMESIDTLDLIEDTI